MTVFCCFLAGWSLRWKTLLSSISVCNFRKQWAAGGRVQLFLKHAQICPYWALSLFFQKNNYCTFWVLWFCPFSHFANDWKGTESHAKHTESPGFKSQTSSVKEGHARGVLWERIMFQSRSSEMVAMQKMVASLSKQLQSRSISHIFICSHMYPAVQWLTEPYPRQLMI